MSVVKVLQACLVGNPIVVQTSLPPTSSINDWTVRTRVTFKINPYMDDMEAERWSMGRLALFIKVRAFNHASADFFGEDLDSTTPSIRKDIVTLLSAGARLPEFEDLVTTFDLLHLFRAYKRSVFESQPGDIDMWSLTNLRS